MPPLYTCDMISISGEKLKVFNISDSDTFVIMSLLLRLIELEECHHVVIRVH